jgi:mono/diheme cytochrome c family protein
MRALSIFLALSVVAACGDPVHDRAVEALGPEKPGVPKGPLHRAGQPCLTCHGGDGPGSPEMEFGGTAYAFEGDPAPAAGAAVRLLDANNRTYDVTANCAGNFWVPKGAFGGTFPMTAAVSVGGLSRVMTTQMHREGACADCHTDPAGVGTPGQLWVLPAGRDAPDATCGKDETVHGTAGVLPECAPTPTDCTAPFPTYTKDLAPIIAANCLGCHGKDGENSDYPLTTFNEVSSAKTRATANNLVVQCRMPPPPLPPLSPEDRKTFTCWIAGKFLP